MYLTIVVSRGVLWLRTNSVSFSVECVLKNTSIFSTNDGLIEGQQTSIFLTSEKPSRDFAWMTLKHKKVPYISINSREKALSTIDKNHEWVTHNPISIHSNWGHKDS